MTRHTMVDLFESVAAGPTEQRLLADRYEVCGLVGVGGMGSVYRVRDRSLDEIVALKLIRADLVDRPGMSARLRSEVKLARLVSHENVVRTFDIGECVEGPFITMAFVDGSALSARIAAGALRIEELSRIFQAICGGVEAAHRAGVLHLDLKPDNVLVAHDGRVLVSDFGLAHAVRGEQAIPGRFIGTVGYAAPEQLRGEPLDRRADVYALGVLLFECLSGAQAFPGEDVPGVLALREARPRPDATRIRGVSPEIVAIVQRALSPDRSTRFATVADLCTSLLAVAGSAGGRGLGAPSGAPPATASPVSRWSLELPRAVAPRPEPRAPSVAVLPFLSADDDRDLAHGLSAELVDVLATTAGLRVRPYRSVLRFQDSLDAVEAGRLLGVETVVEGRVRRAGGDLVVTVALHVVEDGLQLWGRRLVTNEAMILDLAEQIGPEVARALSASLVSTPLGLPAPDAASLFLRARHQLQVTWDSGVELAAAALADAALLAPEDPRIAAALATARARQAFWSSGDDRTLLAAAKQAAERAIHLAPTLADAWYALSMVRRYEGDTAGGAAALVRALAFAPGLAAAHEALGGVLLEAGHLDDAVAHLEAARRLDPDCPVVPYDLPRAFALRGEWARARAYLDRLPSTGVPGLRRALGLTRLRLWETGAAGPLPEGFSPQHPSEAEVIPAWGRIYASGRLDAADLRIVTDAAAAGAPRLRVARRQFLAEVRAAFGDPDGAVTDIREAVRLGLQDFAWLRRCPLFADLRKNSAFQESQAIVRERAEHVLVAVAR